MSIPGSGNPMLLAGLAGGYEIEQSLRFNPPDSTRLYRTLAASQTRTYSFWYKYANLSGGNMYLFHHQNSGGTNYLGVRSGGSPSENQWQTLNQGSSFTEINQSRKYRDPSAWQHVVWKCTSTNVTMYVNGVEFASTGGATIALTGGTLEIGARSSAEYFGGYIAEFHFVDGTAYNPTDFGEFNDDGVWVPKRFGGTYGSNGAYLKFDPTATNGIGHDHSGNGNNFTATGFDSTNSTASTYDVMDDTPTTNWCTLNPLNSGSFNTLSNGNLDVVGNTVTNNGNSRGTIVFSTGKWYAEMVVSAAYISVYPTVGVVLEQDAQLPDNGGAKQVGYPTDSVAYESSGQKRVANTTSSYGASFTTNDVIGIAIDADNGAIYFSKNGTYQNSGDPTSGASKTGAAFTWTGGSKQYAFATSQYNGSSATFNFGQRAFAYTPPTGFKALNTANLPAPTIKDGGDHFNTVLYNGTGAELAVSGVGFQPDFTWLKRRNNVSDHHLFDAVRGVTKGLFTNDTKIEETNAQFLKTFDTDGFTLGTNGGLNASGSTNVAWNWKANGAGSSNTDGSITSTVSASPTAGFSIVSYTGNQASTQTVGHGLGVTPSFIIVKDRDNSSRNWVCYHKDLGLDKVILLNSANAPQTISGYWGTSITSTVFGLPAGGYDNNPTGDKLIAYCFAEVAGYSKFGSYTGNGSSDGPFVFCGFKPRWILLKSTSSGSWELYDTARDTYNQSEKTLEPNSSAVEGSGYPIDILSNGFKVRTSNSQINYSSYTYIFAAFASNPFGGSGVSPATAR